MHLNNYDMHIQKKQKGFALLLALIISSVVLAIGVSILHISVNQINLSATARESEFAFQASHAGVDCLMYWRNEKSIEFIDSTVSLDNPSIQCFGDDPISTSKSSYAPTSGTGYLHSYTNQFEWGSPLRCTNVSMFVINATGADDAVVAFTNNEGIGENRERLYRNRLRWLQPGLRRIKFQHLLCPKRDSARILKNEQRSEKWDGVKNDGYHSLQGCQQFFKKIVTTCTGPVRRSDYNLLYLIFNDRREYENGNTLVVRSKFFVVVTEQ
jgi:hypothetical protein